MIKSLKIQNYQSHEKTELDFSPGVNIIVGSSDSGKTAIIRALRWVSWNRPSGDAIRSTWGGDTFVLLETEEGYILRFKGKEDKYELKRGDKKSMVFKAFGTNVPEEITSFLNINEINLQQQLDAPFLLSETPGAVAQHFNKIAKLDKIDTSLQKINSAIRELAQDIRYNEDREDKLKEEIKTFNYLEKMEIDIEVLEETHKQWLNKVLNKTNLERIIKNINHINILIESKSNVLTLEKPLEQVFKWKDAKELLENSGKELNNLLDSISQVQEDIKEKKSILTLEKPVNALLALYTSKNTLKSSHTTLNKLLSSINRVYVSIQGKEAEKGLLEVKFKKEMGSVCILCGSKLK